MVPLIDRTCKLRSNNATEDEMHFLMTCEFYFDLRRPLFAKAQNCNSDFQNSSPDDKFLYIMNFINMQHLFYTKQ